MHLIIYILCVLYRMLWEYNIYYYYYYYCLVFGCASGFSAKCVTCLMFVVAQCLFLLVVVVCCARYAFMHLLLVYASILLAAMPVYINTWIDTSRISNSDNSNNNKQNWTNTAHTQTVRCTATATNVCSCECALANAPNSAVFTQCTCYAIYWFWIPTRFVFSLALSILSCRANLTIPIWIGP